MKKATRPDDARLKVNRDKAKFMQRAVYAPMRNARQCSIDEYDEVAALYASDLPQGSTAKRTWLNTPPEQMHLLPDSQLLHLLFSHHAERDRQAGLQPLEYSGATRFVRELLRRAQANPPPSQDKPASAAHRLPDADLLWFLGTALKQRGLAADTVELSLVAILSERASKRAQG